MVDSSMFAFPRWWGPTILIVGAAILIGIGFLLGKFL